MNKKDLIKFLNGFQMKTIQEAVNVLNDKNIQWDYFPETIEYLENVEIYIKGFANVYLICEDAVIIDWEIIE